LGVIGLVGLAVVACAALYFFFPQVLGLPASGPATRTRVPAPTATTRPARTATEAGEEPTARPSATPKPPTDTPVPLEATVIVIIDDFGNAGTYTDDFEDSDSGWTLTSDDVAEVDYVDGELAFQMLAVSSYANSFAPADDFTSVHLSVTARTVGEPKDAPIMGFLCAVQTDNSYYYLGFSEDGYYGIGYYDGQDSKLLTSAENEYSSTDAAAKFADDYYLEADCQSDGTLRLLVDGVEVASVVDTSLGPGGVGLYTSSFKEVPVEVRFDDLEATDTGEGDLLFSDDFQTGGNWWTGGDAQHAIAYKDGMYDIQVFDKNLIGWGNPTIDVSDVHIAVTVLNPGGATTAGFGVICNYQPDSGEYYYLGFGADGYYAIGYSDGQALNVLTDPDSKWLRSEDIAVGQATYQLAADCAADGTLSLWVDEIEIVSVQDDRLSSGDIGLFVESFEQVPVEVQFDNVRVTALQ